MLKFAITAAVLVAALSGCSDSPTLVHPFSLNSPDGQHVASAVYEQYAGSGNNAIVLRVALKYSSQKEGMDVLDADLHDLGRDHFQLRWLNSQTLMIVVHDANVVFQAVKCAGVDVITREA